MAKFEPKKTRCTEIRVLTPDDCKNIWENRRDPLNRWDERHKDKIAASMRNREFPYNAEGIKFDPDGMLIDGHHRVRACMESGVSFETLVCYGVDRDSLAKPERKLRTLSNSCIMYGGIAWASPKVVQVLRILDVGFGTCSSRQHTVDDIGRYEAIAAHVKRAIELLPDTKKIKGIGTAGVRACIVCAAADGVSKEDIDRFCEILITGEIRHPSEAAAIRCRDFLIDDPKLNWLKQNSASTARIIMHSIKLFTQRKHVTVLRTVRNFAYEIPRFRASSTIKNGVAKSTIANNHRAGIAAKRVTK